MSTASDLTDALSLRIQEAAPDIIAQVTTDPTLVKPSPGKVSVWIEPPDYEWPGWYTEPDLTFRLMVVAGTPDRHLAGLDLIQRAMDALHATHQIGLAKAAPVGFDLNGRTLAAYEITLHEL